jgi:two-component system, NarL family, sensor histidine kinase EvgS
MCLRVADSGIGMDSATLARLFQPFMQAELATVRRYGGTGLGLAITHRLVSLMGGQIEVQSAVGQGTAFLVLLDLPAAASQTLPPVLPVPTRAAATQETPLILVAEDDAVNRMVITRQLELLGYAAELAEDGHTALAMWRSGRFGLLLTDLHMPGMDGYELARTIRQEEAPDAVRRPILALTANAMKGEARRALDLGLDAYLTKPIRMADLQAALQTALQRGPLAVPLAGAAVPQPERPSVSSVPSLPFVPPPLPGAGVPATFERQTLRDLLGDDPATLRRLLQEFCTTTPACLADLTDALRRADWPAAKAAAHSLNPAAQTVGALALAAWCAQAERAADGPGGLAGQATALADCISAGWPPLLQALNTELAALAALAPAAPAPTAVSTPASP